MGMFLPSPSPRYGAGISRGSIHISDLLPKPLTSEQLRSWAGLETPAQITKTRLQCRKWISCMCTALKLQGTAPNYTPWFEQTATYYVNRFYAVRSVQRNDLQLVCSAAVFLAAKSLESVRPLKHVAYEHAKLKLQLNKSSQAQQQLEELRKQQEKKLAEMGLVEDLLLAERALLYALSFDLRGYQLLGHLGTYLAAVGAYVLKQPADKQHCQPYLSEAEQVKLTKLAINFYNDVFRSDLALRFTVQQAAAACVQYAASFCKLQLRIPTSHTKPLGPTDKPLGPGYELTAEQYAEFEREHRAQLLKQDSKADASVATAASTTPSHVSATTQQTLGVEADSRAVADVKPVVVAASLVGQVSPPAALQLQPPSPVLLPPRQASGSPEEGELLGSPAAAQATQAQNTCCVTKSQDQSHSATEAQQHDTAGARPSTKRTADTAGLEHCMPVAECKSVRVA